MLTQRTIADSLTRIPLVLRYHRAIRSISSIFHKHIHIIFSHPPNLVLLCLNMYLSLPSYVPTRRKSAICGLPVRNQSSRLMLWCYTPFFTKSSSRRATGSYIDRVKLELLRGRGGRFGNPEVRPLGTFETNSKLTASERSISTIFRGNRGL